MLVGRELGVDPGGRSTGVVVRERSVVLHVAVLVRVGDDPIPDDAYLNWVLDEIAVARDIAGPECDISTESVNKPSWHMKRHGKPAAGAAANVEGLMGTCMVFGAIAAVYRPILVPPGGHGSAPLASYPRELVGGPHNERWKHPEPKGTGVLRHARSAFDIARAGRAYKRLARA